MPARSPPPPCGGPKDGAWLAPASRTEGPGAGAGAGLPDLGFLAPMKWGRGGSAKPRRRGDSAAYANGRGSTSDEFRGSSPASQAPSPTASRPPLPRFAGARKPYLVGSAPIPTPLLRSDPPHKGEGKKITPPSPAAPRSCWGSGCRSPASTWSRRGPSRPADSPGRSAHAWR